MPRDPAYGPQQRPRIDRADLHENPGRLAGHEISYQAPRPRDRSDWTAYTRFRCCSGVYEGRGVQKKPRPLSWGSRLLSWSLDIFVLDKPLHPEDISVAVAMTKATSDARKGAYKDALSPWTWEIISCTSSSILLTAIIVILARVDGRPQEEWHLSITLNSLINTLSTLFRASLAATATEVISQQKWIWFWSTPESSRRPISHMQSFDAGSRNLLGGLKLLPIVARQYPFAILPVVVLISSLLVGPFAQQSIRVFYKDVPSELGAASLPISRVMDAVASNSYYNTMPVSEYSFFTLKNDPRISVFNTVSNPSSQDLTIFPDCPTGNCDFPPMGSSHTTHTSLGICSKCSDMTSLVEQQGDDGDYRLPHFGIQHKIRLAVETLDNLTWAATTMTTEHKAISRWALVNATVLTVSDVGQPLVNGSARYPSSPVAVSCSLYACLRSYRARIRDNNLVETLESSTPLAPDVGNFTGTGSELSQKIWVDFNIPSESSRSNLSAIQLPCRIGNQVYTASNMSQAPGALPVRLIVPAGAPDYPPTPAPEECISRIDMFTYKLAGGAYRSFLTGGCRITLDSQNRLFCGSEL